MNNINETTNINAQDVFAPVAASIAEDHKINNMIIEMANSMAGSTEIAADVTNGAESTETAVEAASGTSNEITLPADKNANTGSSDTYIHKFKKPFKYEGKNYTTINFCFGKLTGSDMLKIESEMQANNEYALDPLLSRNFLSKMASKAAGISSDVIESMPLQEFNKITNAARNFLIDSGY